jgi:hypothetical protein
LPEFRRAGQPFAGLEQAAHLVGFELGKDAVVKIPVVRTEPRGKVAVFDERELHDVHEREGDLPKHTDGIVQPPRAVDEAGDAGGDGEAAQPDHARHHHGDDEQDVFDVADEEPVDEFGIKVHRLRVFAAEWE